MTQLLEQAFSEAARLSELEQNVVARWLLLELASEKRWMETFADSEDLLSDLADEALAEHMQGKTKLLD
ncbi:MAG: hypothetical protein NT166_14430 [Candidatus Aminicenantes bacterium]|nr:hypothetical protein [Candidatus Aminicenantes bacterium]